MPDKKTVYWFSLYFDIYRDIMKLPTVKQSFYLIIFAKSLKIFREGLSFPMINVKALADAHYDELVKLRRYFHEHPELSNVEDATCDTIQKNWKNMESVQKWWNTVGFSVLLTMALVKPS